MHMKTSVIFHVVSMILLSSIVPVQAGEIHTAAASGDLNKVRFMLGEDSTLLESRDENGSTPLHITCIRNQVALAHFLLDQGANVNARNKWGQTPLHWANGVFGQDISLIRRLIDLGSDVNACGNRGESVLQWAAMRNNYDVVKLLIEKGADLELYDQNFGTVLHNAIRENRLEMAMFLVHLGADLNRKDPLGYSVLHLATLFGGADLVKLLIQKGADIHATDSFGNTSLYFAAKHGYKSIADILLKAGSDKNQMKEIHFGKPEPLVKGVNFGEGYLWYLGIDGYAIKTQTHLILFDPPGINESIERGLSNGNLNPSELDGQNITVIITKPDWERYDLGVFRLGEKIRGVNYVVSFNPQSKLLSMDTVPTWNLVIPGQNFILDSIQIQTIPASLGGIACMIETDGLKIYYGGYHACNDSSQAENFRNSLKPLLFEGQADIAILPVSGHLISTHTYEHYRYLLEQLQPEAVYLMHGFYDYYQYENFAQMIKSEHILVHYPQNTGDLFYYKKTLLSD